MAIQDVTKKILGGTASFGKKAGGINVGGKQDLSTSEGLYQLASQVGLKSQADKILASKGEKPKEIFSGGFISDIFDALNALQYGVVGLLKGKGFAEGVRTRQSFSDKDALGDNGLPGVIGGIALDIAVDPLTYIAPWTILKKVGIVKKLAPVAKMAEGTKLGQWFGRKFVYMFGADPIFKEAYERSIKNISISGQNISEMTRGIADLTPEISRKLLTKDETGRFMRRPLEGFIPKAEKGIIPKELEPLAQEARKYKSAEEFKLSLKKQLDETGHNPLTGGEFSYHVSEQPNLTTLKGEKSIGGTTFAYGSYPSGDRAGTVYMIDMSKIPESQIMKGGGANIRIKGDIPNDAIINLGKKVANKPFDVASAFYAQAKGIKEVRVGGLKDILSPEEFGKVETAWNKLDDLGKQAVDLGLLGKGKWEENLGEYIKNAYLEYEQKKGGRGIFGFMKLGIKGIKKRVPGLTPEKMAELGQIENPAYLLFKSMFDLTKDVENAKLFSLVNKTFASNVLVEGFEKLPDVKRLGELAGKYVPQNIFDYIQEISKPLEIGLGKKLVAGFKFSKVILNPATHARNIMSNQVLNWWKLGMNPLDPRTIEVQGEAIAQIFKKGGNWIEEAKTVGYNLNTFASNEVRDILLKDPTSKSFLNKFRGVGEKLASIYQGEENFAKLSAFIFNRKYKGLGIEDAWKMAESATFNYAQVTPFIRKIRESLFGFPFITFTYKATPLAIETALKAPRRISVFGKIKNGLEQLANIKETEKEKASEPAWIRDGFFIKLPMKDKHGRSAYFDLSYIIPFGDVVSGQFFTRQIKRETGLRESLTESLAERAPLLNLIKELSRNQDFYGDKIWKESDSEDKKLGDLFRHIVKTYSPPLISDQLPGGYIPATNERRIKGIIGAARAEEDIKQQRTLMQEMLRNIGLKIQPIDMDIQETYMEWEKKKALETMLKESDILKEFTKTYIPK